MRKFESLGAIQISSIRNRGSSTTAFIGNELCGTFAILGYAVHPGRHARRGEKKVYAHWHWFPASFGQPAAEVDLYADYCRPEGIGW